MAVDLAVATPAFLDLTFVGLEALPAAGEERFAADLVRSPGGGGIVAAAAARLGLSVALAAPLGEDPAGDLVRAALEEAGVEIVSRRARRTPITVVLPVDRDRAMVTVDPGVRASSADVAALEPAAVAVSLDQLYCVPPGARAYVTCGDDDARAYARRPPAALAAARALFLNRREALLLADARTVEAAAERLAAAAETVVVTLGDEGALCVGPERVVRVPAVDVGRVIDKTGAGDLLAAAYVWADRQGFGAEDRLAWAVLYAGLSVTAPTAVGGALGVERLLDEGLRRGLPAPFA